MRRHVLLPLLLAACAPAAPSAPPPTPLAPPVVALPVPAPANEPGGRPPAGDWTYIRDGAASRATFGGAAAASLSCEADGRLRLRVEGRGPAPLTVRTSTVTRTLAPGPDGAWTLEARDPLLDAMAFSRGRFTLEQPGVAPLALPAWAELGRVIEDCRAPR